MLIGKVDRAIRTSCRTLEIKALLDALISLMIPHLMFIKHWTDIPQTQHDSAAHLEPNVAGPETQDGQW